MATAAPAALAGAGAGAFADADAVAGGAGALVVAEPQEQQNPQLAMGDGDEDETRGTLAQAAAAIIEGLKQRLEPPSAALVPAGEGLVRHVIDSDTDGWASDEWDGVSLADDDD
jgi:hypothetical protein